MAEFQILDEIVKKGREHVGLTGAGHDSAQRSDDDDDPAVVDG